jgi:uncharacterized protein (UPF0332 family)
MSTPTKDDILKIKIGRANKTLSEADKMMEFNFNRAALNRFYYACFYAATALLYKKDIFTKTHSGVKQMLGLHYVSVDIMPKSMGTFYGNIFISRLGSDYDDLADPDPGLVKEYAILAKEFVTTAQNILEIK